MMRRFNDWRSRLATAIEQLRRTADTNCGLFVADAIMAMTGVDLAARYRGRFTSIEEGLALLAADGYADLCDFLSKQLEEVSPARANVGDVMAFPTERTGWALGIVNGERVTVWQGRGLGTMPREGATRAFRVPA